MVVRDSARLIIAALTQRVRLPGLVDVVEALAAHMAICFAKELSLHHLVIERDSLRVIQAIIDTRPVQTLYGHIIDEIRFLSSSIYFMIKIYIYIILNNIRLVNIYFYK